MSMGLAPSIVDPPRQCTIVIAHAHRRALLVRLSALGRDSAHHASHIRHRPIHRFLLQPVPPSTYASIAMFPHNFIIPGYVCSPRTSINLSQSELDVETSQTDLYHLDPSVSESKRTDSNPRVSMLEHLKNLHGAGAPGSSLLAPQRKVPHRAPTLLQAPMLL